METLIFYADLERMITRKWTVECEPHQNNKKPVQKKTMSQVNHLYFSMLSNWGNLEIKYKCSTNQASLDHPMLVLISRSPFYMLSTKYGVF